MPYKTQTFVVPARRTHDLTLPGVQRGYRIDGYFVISGGGTDIGFRVRGPLGRDLIRELRVENRHDFNYTMTEEGPYTLVFDNAASFRADRRVMLFWRGYPAK